MSTIRSNLVSLSAHRAVRRVERSHSAGHSTNPPGAVIPLRQTAGADEPFERRDSQSGRSGHHRAHCTHRSDARPNIDPQFAAQVLGQWFDHNLPAQNLARITRAANDSYRVQTYLNRLPATIDKCG